MQEQQASASSPRLPRRPSRFPLVAAGAVSLAVLTIGAGAHLAGVPWIAVAISAVTVIGITAWSVATDPDIRSTKAPAHSATEAASQL